jgi:hypothetical protein
MFRELAFDLVELAAIALTMLATVITVALATGAI